MVADPGDLPPTKRRTRIKVNLPVLNESKHIDNSFPNKINQKVNEDETDVTKRGTPSSDEDDNFELMKSGTHKENIIDEDSGSLDADVYIPTPEKSTLQDPPRPAPRAKKVLSTSSTDQTQSGILEDDKTANADREIGPPRPMLRTLKPVSGLVKERSLSQADEKVDKKESRKKKIFKAADVISSVLRKENKSIPQIATVLPEAGDEKKCDAGDDVVLNSPWDSPPPPQVLDKVYIQNKHGFSAHDWADLFKKPDSQLKVTRTKQLTDIALYFHNLWTRFMTFSHGVIAGIACCHILSVAAALSATQSDVEQFVQFYHFLSLKVHFAVYVFTTLCIISCFDRLDIGELTKTHLREVGRSHGTLFTMLAYLFCLILSLAAHRHTAAIDAYKTNPNLWDAQGLQEWYWLVTCRDVVLLLIWICIAFSSQTDLLYDKLTKLRKEQIRSGSGFKLNSPAGSI